MYRDIEYRGAGYTKMYCVVSYGQRQTTKAWSFRKIFKIGMGFNNKINSKQYICLWSRLTQHEFSLQLSSN